MALKVKELKDDVLIDIQVNKNYYLMLKATLLYLFNASDTKNREESIKRVMEGDYAKMSPYERSFYTLTLMLGEIERVAKDKNLYTESEILQPDDEGYVAPIEE